MRRLSAIIAMIFQLHNVVFCIAIYYDLPDYQHGITGIYDFRL